MGNAIFRVFQLRNPWNDSQKMLHSWLRRWLHTTRKYLHQSAQRGTGRVCTCVKLSSSGVYFFFFRFFSFMRIATGPPIGPISAGNGLNDAFWWHAHSLYGLVKEIWKIALQPMATSKSHNSGTVKDTCKMFAPNSGFSGLPYKECECHQNASFKPLTAIIGPTGGPVTMSMKLKKT